MEFSPSEWRVSFLYLSWFSQAANCLAAKRSLPPLARTTACAGYFASRSIIASSVALSGSPAS
eukprot:710330-Alexandrium_andersonii.AAC.1